MTVSSDINVILIVKFTLLCFSPHYQGSLSVFVFSRTSKVISLFVILWTSISCPRYQCRFIVDIIERGSVSSVAPKAGDVGTLAALFLETGSP